MRYALGVDLGCTNIRGAVVSEGGTVMSVERRACPAHAGPEAVMEALIATAKCAADRACVSLGELVGIGVGSPGIVDAHEGVVLAATPNLPGWAGMRLRDRLEGAFGISAFVDNDVNAIGLGEHKHGAGAGYKDVVCIAIGSGIGGAVVLDGQLRRGARWMAGSVGHMAADSGGRLCNCGRVGCVESYASAWSVAHRARTRIAAGGHTLITELAGGNLDAVDAAVVFDAAKEGDLLALVIVNETARVLAQIIVDIWCLLDPQCFVIAGGLAHGYDLIERVRQELVATVPVFAGEPPPVVPGRLGDDAGVVGAASLVFSA